VYKATHPNTRGKKRETHECNMKIGTWCWDLGQTNSPTSARRGDGFGYIRIWATPPKRLVFWDGAPSPYEWYQSHAPNLVVCVGDVRSPKGATEGTLGPC